MDCVNNVLLKRYQNETKPKKTVYRFILFYNGNF